MKKIQAILLVVLVGALLVSCDSATTQELSPKIALPTYTANVEPIMSANCVGCHAGGAQNPDLDSYAAVKEATLNGYVLCRMSGTCGNIMPQSGALPQATIDIITTWATNNCPE